jgi:hypothetical protein
MRILFVLFILFIPSFCRFLDHFQSTLAAIGTQP